MSGPFSLLASSWKFFRSQPALNAVLLWLLTLPLALSSFLDHVGSKPTAGTTLSPYDDRIPRTTPAITLFFIGIALLLVLQVWGNACVLTAGKRLLESKAGRSRTSFSALRRIGARHIFPLILTGLLRTCNVAYRGLLVLIPLFMLLISRSSRISISDVPGLAQESFHQFQMLWGKDLIWTLLAVLLLLPAFVYSIRTSFYGVIAVGETTPYRAGLNKSRTIVSGHTWPTFGILLSLWILLFVPSIGGSALLEYAVRAWNPRMLPVSDLISAFVVSLASMLYLLSLTKLYSELKGMRAGHEVRMNN